jgi:hypothetical protein
MHVTASIALVTACVITVTILWLCLGRRISMLVDSLFPGQPKPQPTDPMSIAFDPNGISSRFTLASWTWPLSWPWPPGPFDLKIILSRRQELILCADGRSFAFGPVQKMWADTDKPQYQFIPAADDGVSFTRDLGRLPWLTPFTFNIMGVSVPKAKRYAYDRLRWTKPGGSTLEIIWRNEYWWYPRTGWNDTYNIRLLSVRIRLSPLEKSAAA